MLSYVDVDPASANAPRKHSLWEKLFVPRRETSRRRRSDALRLALGLLGLGLSILWALFTKAHAPATPQQTSTQVSGIATSLSSAERSVFGFINHTTDALYGPLWTVMQLGALATVGAATALALVGRRRRLAEALALGGFSAWLLAKVLKQVAARDRPDALLADVIIRGQPAAGLGFPSGHAAVAATLMTVASPYVTRPVRGVGWTLVFLVGFARIYVGAHLPVDVVGGVSLGLVLGSSVNLLLKTP